MAEKLLGWGEPTRITVYPNDVFPIQVADVILGEGHDTLWVRIKNIPGDDCTFPFSYGLLTWVSAEGRELGTVKAYGHCESEVFKLGVGRTPLERAGKLVFDARGYNLQWIDKGHPWTLEFQSLSGQDTSGNPPDPDALTGNTLGSFAPENGRADADFTFDGIFAELLLRFIAR